MILRQSGLPKNDFIADALLQLNLGRLKKALCPKIGNNEMLGIHACTQGPWTLKLFLKAIIEKRRSLHILNNAMEALVALSLLITKQRPQNLQFFHLGTSNRTKISMYHWYAQYPYLFTSCTYVIEISWEIWMSTSVWAKLKNAILRRLRKTNTFSHATCHLSYCCHGAHRKHLEVQCKTIM